MPAAPRPRSPPTARRSRSPCSRTPSITSSAGDRSVLLAVVLAAAGASAAPVRLPVTADASIACHPTERGLNAGRSPRLKLKGIENVILLDVDPAPLAGRVVASAVLRLKETDANLMVRKVGWSQVSAAWGEGTRGTEEPAGAGEACFLHPGAGGAPWWAGPGSTFLDAVFGRGGAAWGTVEAVRDARGWYAIPLDGRLLEARAAGLSHGIALSDDNGQTMNISRELMPGTNFSNNYFFSRERSGAGPFIEAELGPPAGGTAEPDGLAVAVGGWAGGASEDAGGVEIAWPGPATAGAATGLLGYRVRVSVAGSPLQPLPRWSHPPVPPAGEQAAVRLPGLPPGAAIVAEVEAVGRGGAAAGLGRGAGFVSAALRPAVPLNVEEVVPGARGTDGESDGSWVWAVPDGVKVNPVTGNVLEEPGVEYAGDPAGSWRRSNHAWDGETVRLAALRGEWAAFTLVLEAPEGGAAEAEYLIAPAALRGPGGATIRADALRLSRAWYQRTGSSPRAWHADPLLPAAGGRVRVPAPDNAVPGQRNQSVYVELLVPRDARPGEYAGRLRVSGPGGTRAVGVRLRVGRHLLPSAARFVWSLNAYRSPGYDAGPSGSAAFLAEERAFYAMAHAHRATLAILHYSHAGDHEPGAVPPVAGRGAAARIADWSEFDRRFGPLFDGRAFAGTGREDVPLDHFYLALSEHYPVPMSEGYRWNDVRWEDHWRVAGPVEEGFTPEARAAWVAVARDILAHVRSRGWRTRFQAYLNDKYFYKQYDPARRAWGRGVSFWLLDEPMHADDFAALRHFGSLLREAQAGDRSRLVFRADISRPDWARDTLDRVLDLQVSGGFSEHARLLLDWRERHGGGIWTYGGSLPSAASALGYSALALSLLSRGVDGYVPWLVLGEDADWERFASTCLMYPGRPRGVAGPCASLRLKAVRRAEQDAEYLLLLSDREGLLRGDPRRVRLEALVRRALPARRVLAALDMEGAVTESYEGLTPGRLEAFRRAIERRLDASGDGQGGTAP